MAKAEGATYLPEPALAPGEKLLDVDLTYVDRGGAGHAQQLAVAAPAQAPSAGLRLGHLLIDEFQSLHKVATLYHENSDEEGAYQTLKRFDERLRAETDPKLAPERKLVGQLLTRTALLSGHAGEAPAVGPAGLVGAWTIARIEGEGQVDLKRGDRLTFGDEDLIVERRKGRAFEEDPSEGYMVNDTQLSLEESELVFDYRLADSDLLVLTNKALDLRLVLRRAPLPVATASVG